MKQHATTPGLYADALIYDILHDTGSGSESLAEAKLLVAIARATRAGFARDASSSVRTARGTPLRCYEPACGSGRVLVALAKLGHHAVGSDIDPQMVSYANERLRELGLHQERSTRASASRTNTTRTSRPSRAAKGVARAVVCAMDAAPTTKVAHAVLPAGIDLAMNPINSIRHLASDAAMLKHLCVIKSLLATDGVYIVGLSLSMVGSEQASEDIWQGSRKGIQVTQVVQYLPPTKTQRGAAARREQVLSHLTIARKGQAEEHRDSAYWLRTYSKSQWLALVSRAGLHVHSTYSTEGIQMPAGELGYYWFVLCHKRRSTNGR